VQGVSPSTPAAFFAALRAALPRDAILTLDSGQHQMLARRHYRVLAPRALIAPSDFQSMGFGLPAALGAAVAAPERRVVALIGDGGFAMSGLELLTAVRERLPLTVVVFNDGALGLIRDQQHREFGRAHGTALHAPDYAGLAAALGAGYALVDGDAEATLRAALAAAEPVLVEVRLGASARQREVRAKGLARAVTRRALGPRLLQVLKRLLS
jgi:acetolactate synthase-1/2/3 large subunit